MQEYLKAKKKHKEKRVPNVYLSSKTKHWRSEEGKYDFLLQKVCLNFAYMHTYYVYTYTYTIYILCISASFLWMQKKSNIFFTFAPHVFLTDRFISWLFWPYEWTKNNYSVQKKFLWNKSNQMLVPSIKLFVFLWYVSEIIIESQYMGGIKIVLLLGLKPAILFLTE